VKAKPVPTDIGRRLLGTRDVLASELMRRGMLTSRETQELLGMLSAPKRERVRSARRLSNVIFASELANADRMIAARAVVRGLLSREELTALQMMLKFQPRGKRENALNELTRTVERALEGEGNGEHS
jgi:hypothetical protein